jgi:hypothetical protein
VIRHTTCAQYAFACVQQLVVADVLANHKIRRPVVSTIPVDVVYLHTFRKRAAESCLRDNHVLTLTPVPTASIQSSAVESMATAESVVLSGDVSARGMVVLDDWRRLAAPTRAQSYTSVIIGFSHARRLLRGCKW